MVKQTNADFYLQEGGPSSSSSNLRSHFIGMGFSSELVEKKNWRCEESSIEERSKELKSKYETASKLEKLIKEIYEKIALLQKKEVADAVEKADKANAKNVQLQELIAEYQLMSMVWIGAVPVNYMNCIFFLDNF
ncbi:hypothetical protein FCM35_KLT02146 [Carex littledalei]|uniref:Uncharacterized protein n=1 Tax=Carex littledalei TaxID=544730 RepID=A0A833RB47_9POAL|nr:hypothetical protein FCM35_KLT02146 [Carex littledalei]